MPLVWLQSQDLSKIKERLARRRIKKLWHWLWLLLGVSGVAALAVLFAQAYGNLTKFWSLLQQFSATSLLVWLGVLAALFVTQNFITSWRSRPPLAQTLTQTGSRKIDISKYFSKTALTLLDRSFLEQRAWSPTKLLQILLYDRDVKEIVLRMGHDLKSLSDKISHLLGQDKHNYKVDNLFKNIVFKALEVAYRNNDEEVRTTDLLEALLLVESQTKNFLVDQDWHASLVTGINSWLHYQKKLARLAVINSRWMLNRAKGWRNQLWTSTVTPLLDAVGQDLTLQAHHLPPLIDRQQELQELYEKLGAGSFGVLLAGPHGAGKSRLIEGLARKIILQQVPQVLADRRVVTLSIAKLLTLSNPRQPLKNLTAALAQEIERSGNIIIVLEDLVSIEAAKTDEAAMLLEAVFIDSVKSGQVILLATVDDEVKQQLTGPLAQSLSALTIKPLNDNDTLRVLEARTPYLEAQTGVKLTYPALARTVKLSSQYLHEQAQPGSALALLTKALERKSATGAEWLKVVDIESLVSEKTGLPVSQTDQQESQLLLELEDRIAKKYINQKKAVAVAAAALRRARTELKNEKRPIANFLFLGPTGVGKTELARRLAAVYFGDQNKMIRLDMSEYQEPQSLRNLIGAPAGTGSTELGRLIKAIAQRPFAVILLDEFEKAHPDILNIFLQVMEDGRLTASDGKVYSFANALLIATSNAGSQYIQTAVAAQLPTDQITEVLEKSELPKYFKPELLNRFDAVVVFEPLKFHAVVEIAKLLIQELAEKMLAKEIHFSATNAALQDLATSGFEPAKGARPLRRVLQDKVEDEIAKLLLQKKIRPRDRLILDRDFTLKVEPAQHY